MILNSKDNFSIVYFNLYSTFSTIACKSTKTILEQSPCLKSFFEYCVIVKGELINERGRTIGNQDLF